MVSGESPYLESHRTNPLSAYGRSKLAGEQAVALRAPDRHTVVRSSWLFGARGRCFPATILRLADEREQLSVVDDQRGCPTFTAHLARGLVNLVDQRDLSCPPRTTRSWKPNASLTSHTPAPVKPGGGP